MKNCFVHHASIAEMLDDNSLQELGCDAGVPHAFGIHDDDRPAGADTEARGFASLYACRPEEQILALEQAREKAVERSAPAIRRAEPASADEHVSAVCLHMRPANEVIRHGVEATTTRSLEWPMSE